MFKEVQETLGEFAEYQRHRTNAFREALDTGIKLLDEDRTTTARNLLNSLSDAMFNHAHSDLGR
jgi:hypothetical protein